MENKIDLVSPDSIKPFIYDVRGRNVMIDSDLAALYGIETKNLKRAVRMNIVRFPTDFMFELTKEEYDFLRCNFFTLKNGRGQHSKYLPYAFTQEGIAMLSGLLKTPIAIQVNINIMRAFFQMQKTLLTLQHSNLQIEKIRSEIKQLRIDMDETLRYQNDINEMMSKEQDKLSIQIDNINDVIAKLQAEENQKQLNTQNTKIGFVVRECD
ncbi:MAG: ORF6N domain-containing protein [Bacteroidales bacterium]|nr:ORF6N domain-containing protein [Bacteroidales bacterium]